MTATGHAVIGTAIAASISNPFLAIPLSVISHVAADMTPHWDPGTHRDKKTHDRFFSEAVLDVLVSILVTFFIVVFIFPKTNLAYAYINVFAAQFLDWACMPYLFFKIKNPTIFYHIYRFQSATNNKLDKPWGIIIQVAIVVGIVILAKLVY